VTRFIEIARAERRARERERRSSGKKRVRERARETRGREKTGEIMFAAVISLPIYTEHQRRGAKGEP